MSRVFGCIITLSIFFGLKALFENCFILYYRNFTQKEAGIYKQKKSWFTRFDKTTEAPKESLSENENKVLSRRHPAIQNHLKKMKREREKLRQNQIRNLLKTRSIKTFGLATIKYRKNQRRCRSMPEHRIWKPQKKS